VVLKTKPFFPILGNQEQTALHTPGYEDPRDHHFSTIIFKILFLRSRAAHAISHSFPSVLLWRMEKGVEDKEKNKIYTIYE